MDCGQLNAVSKSLAQAASHTDPSMMMMPPGMEGGMLMGDMEWGHEFQHAGPMPAPYHPFLLHQQQQQQQQHEEEMFHAMEMEEAFAAAQQQRMESAASMQQHPQQQQQQPMMGGPMFLQHRPMMMNPMGGMMMMRPNLYQPMFPVHGHAPQQQADWLTARSSEPQLRQEQPSVKEEDEAPVQTFTVEGEALQSVQEKTDGSAFYKLLRDLQEHKVEIDEVEGKIVEGDPASAQATAADAGGPDLEAMMAAWNAREPLTAEEIAEAEAHQAAWGSDDEVDEDYAGRYMGDDGLFMGDGDGNFEAAAGEHFEELGDEWAREYNEITQRNTNHATNTNYPFEEDNMFLLHDNPMQEGLDLRGGVASESVLAFEAACQQNMESLEAWTLLGTTQAENEKDRLAIIALNNARNLDPKNLTVLAALAVSHTNEGNHTEALQSLRSWLLAHPEYEHLSQLNVTDPSSDAQRQADDADDYTSQFLFVSPSAHRECCALFETAIELNPNDAELYSNLGVLRNLSHEYQEAATHFEAALRLRPDDAKLWNRLGATLANGSRSRDAVAAYHRALDLNPGYVRAQYNLGVAHSNIGEHHEAAKQLLKAVIMQQGGVQSKLHTDDDGAVTGRSTREMWDVLRMTFNILDRPDLVQQTWKMDVEPFLAEFGLESFNF